MSKFSVPITTAVALFPLIALIITVPFMVRKYRKLGSVPFSHALVVYSFVFYLMCAYFLVLLPLPPDRTAIVNYATTPQLVPLAFIRNFLAETTASVTDPSTWASVILDPFIYEALFNVLLLVPLGAYLRYYFRRTWWQTLIIGFLVSLSFETTQLTGIWGIYEHPYRLFDVDDLMTNTLGAMVGFWACGPVMRALPDPRVVARQARRRGQFASATRRALSFGIDIVLSQVIAAAVFVVLGRTDGAATLSDFGVAHARFWTSEAVGIAVVFMLFALATRGQTPSQLLLHMRIVKPDGTDARWWQIIARYATLFAILLVPAWAFGVIAGANDLPTTPGELKTLASSAVHGRTELAALWCVGVATWGASLIVRAWRARWRGEEFLMLNGVVSNTRVMTLSGIADARARRRVLSVEEVIALEQSIAEGGTPLDELMRRAGGAVAKEVTAWVPDPAQAVVLCGSGNNGGDGWVCARELAQRGWDVTLVTPRTHRELSAWPAADEAARTCGAIAKEKLAIEVLVAPEAAVLEQKLEDAQAVVDAILGTGFSGDAVREPYASWIEAANARRSGVGRRGAHARAAVRHGSRRAKTAPFAIAVDVPSGLSAQTGAAALPTFVADETVTMLAFKPGLLARSAKPYTGYVELAELVEEAVGETA